MSLPSLNDDDHVQRLAAWARVNLGMLTGEFYTFTPGEFFLLVDEWIARDRRDRIKFAQVCLTVASSAGAKTATGDPLTLGFFLGERPPVKAKKDRRSLKQQFIDSLPAHYRPNGHR